MKMVVGSGVPSPSRYDSVLSSALFKELESYSDNFLSQHHAILAPYARKWVIDPLHQWSRQWEYPFMAEALSTLVTQHEGPLRVLDAGSGMTFFPYYLMQCFERLRVDCCDRDADLLALHGRVASHYQRPPQFIQADMGDLSYEDNSFDAIYCVSVLEHIPERQQAIKEFARVLKPRGALILSFDLSLDGQRDISISDAQNLLAQLSVYFEGVEDFALSSVDSHDADLFTTLTARARNPQLLPWVYPAWLYRLQALLKGKGWVSWPPRMTVVAATLIRK